MYVLHYAPDNASLILRLALEELGVPYDTRLVDRAKHAHQGPDYLRLNPNGLIPALETPEAGVIFETGAALLWLTDQHGRLAPAPADPARGSFLKWLFFVSNTLHPAMRMLFYPEKYIGAGLGGHVTFLDQIRKNIKTAFRTLNDHRAPPEAVDVTDFYLAACLRWAALYGPEDRDWFCLEDYPVLKIRVLQLETRDSVFRAIRAEGLGPTPFSAPIRPTPPKGVPPECFLSVFDMFKVGIGPSSSHTMGPMVAAARFLDMMRASPFHFAGLRASLHGSLAFTGVGHATERATILGLMGFTPDTYDHEKAEAALSALADTQVISLDHLPPLSFDPKSDLLFDYDTALEGHANGMILMATDAQGDVTLRQVFYSIGGGFVMTEEELSAGKDTDEGAPVPYPFKTATEMLEMSRNSGRSIADMKRANEISRNGEVHLRSGSKRLWQVMNDCINRGLSTDGTVAWRLQVKRRAKGIYDALMDERGMNLTAPHTINDWMSVYAMAVNEENAAGGQVVTAPTNGAAGVLPATLRYYLDHVPGASEAHIEDSF